MPHVHYCGRLRLGGGNYLDPDALNFCRFSKSKNRAIFNVDDITCHWRDSTRPSRLLLGRPFRTWNGQSNRPFKTQKINHSALLFFDPLFRYAVLKPAVDFTKRQVALPALSRLGAISGDISRQLKAASAQVSKAVRAAVYTWLVYAFG
jgi:hypothetical protein